MNRVFLRGLEAHAVIGVYEEERRAPQRLLLELDLALASEAACYSDRLEDTVDYAEVAARVREVLAEGRFALVEAAAERVAQVLVREFSVPWVRISIAKPGVIPGVQLLGAVIERNAVQLRPMAQIPDALRTG